MMIGWILGIVGGTIFLEQKYSSLFSIILWSLMLIMFYGFYYELKTMVMMLLIIVLSIGVFLYAPIHRESKFIQFNKIYKLEGCVSKIRETEKYQWVVMKAVRYQEANGPMKYHLKSNVQIRMNKEMEITPNDILIIQAERLMDEPQMNPSDFDYLKYLKSQNIVATFKATQYIDFNKRDTWNERLSLSLNTQLEKLYPKEKVGIMQAALLGEDAQLNEETKALYNASGIGHVLCISGFHVGVIAGLLMFVLCLLRVPYNLRYLIIIVGIWGYAIISGNSPSTIRASIMTSILYVGRCLWEEEDGLTSWSLAALCILFFSPYQLFQAGFELSFTAVGALLLSLHIIEQKESMMESSYSKWKRTLLMWLSIQLFTWPILSYHFFEIPFLISFLNLIVIPIFSWIIIGGWLSLLFHMLHLPIGRLIAKGIETTLEGIEWIVQQLIDLPLATVCTGRPSLITWFLYGCFLVLLGSVAFGYLKRNQFWVGALILTCSYPLLSFLNPSTLKITLLYVGQGDSTVIETPNRQILVIDGGNVGKGQVVERYIKYKGKREVEALLISHSDADHMGGFFELIESNIKVNKVFISRTDESELLRDFLSLCQFKNIPVYKLGQSDTLSLEALKLICLAPSSQFASDDPNNNSLVCELKYGVFSALFTGDKEKTSDVKMYESIGPISLLKVSHHGSRTGTSKELLLKLRPRYAMISCGRKNLYGHPHQEVIQLLEESNVKISRTDLNGAIFYETNGYNLKETKYREDA